MGRLAAAFPRKGKLEVTQVDMPDYKVHYPSKSVATVWVLAFILIVLGFLLAWRVFEDQSEYVYLAVPCPDCYDNESSASTKDDLILDENPDDEVTSTSSDPQVPEPKDDSIPSTADIMNFLGEIIKNLTVSIGFNEPPAGAPNTNSSDADIKFPMQDESFVKPDTSRVNLLSFLMPPITNLFGFLESGTTEANEGAESSTEATETVERSTEDAQEVTSLIEATEADASLTDETDSPSISTEAPEVLARSTEATEALARSTEATEALAKSTEATDSPSISTEETTTLQPDDQVNITWIPLSSSPENDPAKGHPDAAVPIGSTLESNTPEFQPIPTELNGSIEVKTPPSPPAAVSFTIPAKTALPAPIPDDPATIMYSHAQLNSTSERTESADLKPQPFEVETTDSVLDVTAPKFSPGVFMDGSAQLGSSSEEFIPNENVSILVDNGTLLVPFEPVKLGSNETAIEDLKRINGATSDTDESGEDDDKSPDDFLPAWFYNPLGLLRGRPGAVVN